MAGLTADGLAARGLLTKDARELLTDYIAMVDRVSAIAAAELAGAPLADKDNEWLSEIGGVLEGFWWRSGDKLNTPGPSAMTMPPSSPTSCAAWTCRPARTRS